MISRSIFVSVLFLFFAGTASCQCFDTYRPWTRGNSKTKEEEDEKMLQFCNSFLGCTMPSFSTVTTQNVPISKKTLSGKVTVFYFWGLHGFGLSEIPYLNNLIDTFKRDSVCFVAVCQDDSAKWDPRSEKFFHFQHIARSAELLSKFKTVPIMVIFDRNGKTSFVEFGLESYDHIHSVDRTPKFVGAIRKALKE